jgi:twinkle protein
LERLGVASGTATFPSLSRQREALIFAYGFDWKARSIAEKAFVHNKGAKLTFWNLDRVLATNSEAVFITEGEFDALALVEAGISPSQVLAAPGSSGERAPLEYVDEALEAGLNRVARIVWCGDSDEPGLALREQMVRKFGAARFWFVNWPEGCKDANEFLLSDGALELRELVTEGALQWPVLGLYQLNRLPEPPQRRTWSLGFPEWNGKIALSPGTLSVVTGHPGHGKTHFFAQVWYSVLRANNLSACVATFESQAKPDYRNYIRCLYSGRNTADYRDADAWINDRYYFMVHPDQRPTVEWLLDLAEVAVIRHGVSVVVVDPWNRLESQRDPKQTETEYILQCLRAMYVFAHDMNVHVQIIAHPAKMGHDRRNTAPMMEDIAGSKHWENIPDQGFVVHRPRLFQKGQRQTTAKLYHRKARFQQLGYPCTVEMELDLTRNQFVPARPTSPDDE